MRSLKPETLWIPRRVLGMMLEEATLRFPNETGGVWMGYRVESSRDTVVVDAIGPGPKAGFEPNSFRADVRYQHDQIDQLYHASGRQNSFIGDWHTHPVSRPYLSPIDRAAIREIAGNPLSQQPNPVMGVLGGGEPWRLAAWRYARGRLFGSSFACLMIRLFDDTSRPI